MNTDRMCRQGHRPPRLLVSVADADDAEEALRGGADIIDAKEPARGALGAVSVETLHEICAAVGRYRPVTAAIGDASDEMAPDRLTFDFACAGVAFVKIGFPRLPTAEELARTVGAAVRGARLSGRPCGVVAAVFADTCRPDLADAAAAVWGAARAGAVGILLDTADKGGPGLSRITTAAALRRWSSLAQGLGLFVALAGRVGHADVADLALTGADIIGVRGAACIGGRVGRVAADRVRLLRATLTAQRLEQPSPPRRTGILARPDRAG